MFRRMYKAPGSVAGKTGGTGSVCNVFDKKKKSERIPDGEQVRIFHVWQMTLILIQMHPLLGLGGAKPF